MNDPRAGVPTLERETLVEARAELAQPLDPAGSLARENLDRARPADVAPGCKRVCGVKSRIVAGADRGGDAALGRVAVRRSVRRLRDHTHRRALVGGRKSGREARYPGSDDFDVDLVAFLPHER